MNDEIDNLILNGAIEVAGVDPETGELLYTFTDKLKTVHPELHKESQNMINNQIMMLWEKGFVNIDLLAENPIVTPTIKAFDENEINKLSKSDAYTLKEVLRICSNQ